MENEYIKSNVDEFFGKIDLIQENLSGFSQAIDERRNKINKLLSDIPIQSNILNQSSIQKKSNQVDYAVAEVINDFNSAIRKWNDALQSNLKGIQFIKKHEKYLVVMVFGAVKSGKSSLGNFFAGKYFVDSDIKTEYLNREKPLFVSEESGRKTGGLSTDDNGRTWFTEGSVDTTGAIQYFTLSGLRWVDSPGTGALEKEGDTLNMENMVNEYIPYADLCIFLLNSSEPGLLEDMKYMEKLSREGQESLVVITKSDAVEEDIDDEGELIRVVVAKDDSRRKLQEDDVVKRLSELYPNLDAESFRAISISTLLAKYAIKENNDKKFNDSNLDLLMKILGEKVSKETINLKTKRPKRTLNSFIDKLINGDKIDNKFEGLLDLISSYNDLKQPIDEYKSKIESKKNRVVRLIIQDIQQELRSTLYKWNAKVEKTKVPIESDKMNTEINQIIEDGINRGINKEITYIIEGYSSTSKQVLSNFVNIQSLTKNYEEVEHKYIEHEVVERDPNGIIEHIKSFFGKTYYKSRPITKTKILKIDVGTNIHEVLDSLLVQSRTIINDEVSVALEHIQNSYFLPQEKYIDKMICQIENVIKELQLLKYEDA